MPLVALTLKPGLDSVKTPTLNQGSWSTAKNVRFFNGLPQKESGFVKFTETIDVGLSMRAWRALSGLFFLGIAGDNYLSIFSSGTLYNVTPLTIADTIPISLTTTAGSTIVTITDGVNTPTAGKAVQIVSPVSIGGVVLYGTYLVATVGAGSYTILIQQKAVTSETGGTPRTFTTFAGSADIVVAQQNHGLASGQIAPPILNAVTVGGITIQGNYVITYFSASQYGITSHDTATSTQSVSEHNGELALIFFDPASGGAANAIPASFTSCDNWGEFLLSCSFRGPINVWMPANGTSVLATVVPTAPLSNGFIFVSNQVQQLICCGSLSAASGAYDPMLIRWSDTGDYTQFTVAVSNAAGSFRLAIGSQITAGIPMVGQNLIWTDLTLYSMQYLGSPLIWGFQPLGQDCGCVGPHAAGLLAGTAYWMNRNQFFMLSGDGPQMIECPVWDQVFPNLDQANLHACVCETDAFYGEVGWSVPQTDGSFVFVRLRPDPQHGPAWTASTYHHHTAWVDQNVFGAPIGAHENGLIDQHDIGVDEAQTFQGGALTALPTSLTSGMILLAEGSETIFVREFFPDINWLGTTGTLNFSFKFYDYPESAPRVSGPFAVTPSTEIIFPRGRARAMQIVIEGDDIGSNWRLGDCRYRGQADGKR